MKTTILKKFTTLEQAPKVKADAQEFKAMYTDMDRADMIRAEDRIKAYIAE